MFTRSLFIFEHQVKADMYAPVSGGCWAASFNLLTKRSLHFETFRKILRHIVNRRRYTAKCQQSAFYHCKHKLYGIGLLQTPTT